MEAYWYWFCHELYLDRVWARELLGYYKNPEAVYRTNEAELLKLFPRKAARHLDFIKKRKNWVISEEWEKCQDKGIGFYSCEMEAFPQTLRDIPDAPLGIFVKGELPDPGLPAIAIVGARMCSAYGQVTASLFGRELAEHGVQIISGMAAGVDGYAHRGALKAGGKTFGILGCGVDVCYPRQNRDIYEAMAISGGLLSEYPPGTPPLPYLFPIRNRVISGLSRAVLVVEAREKSGSLITADLALEQGKEVYAVPGRIDDVLSRGCNHLLAQGAAVADSPEGLCRELGLLMPVPKPADGKNKKSLESAELLVYTCLGFHALHIEEIRKKAGLPLLQVMRTLVSLELKGYACEIRKNYYTLSSHPQGVS